jgi:hypothetical protein
MRRGGEAPELIRRMAEESLTYITLGRDLICVFISIDIPNPGQLPLPRFDWERAQISLRGRIQISGRLGKTGIAW